MRAITQADLAKFSQDLARNDRAGFYLDYYNATGSKQILDLAQVSSFSGVSGTAASIANAVDASIASNYPEGGVESFSLSIAQAINNAVALQVSRGGSGILTDSQVLQIAQGQWQNLELGKFFPGNALAVEAVVTGDSAYLSTHAGDLLTVGAVVGGASGLYAMASEAPLAEHQMENQALINFVNAIFGSNLSVPVTLPANTQTVTSVDGKVTWLVNSAGNVAYGSVKVGDGLGTPSLPQNVKIVISNSQGQTIGSVEQIQDNSGTNLSFYSQLQQNQQLELQKIYQF